MNRPQLFSLVAVALCTGALTVSAADTDCLKISTVSVRDTLATVGFVNTCNDAIVAVSVALSYPSASHDIRAVVDYSVGFAFPIPGDPTATLSGYLQPGESRDTPLSTTQWQLSPAPTAITVRVTGILFDNGKQGGKLDDLAYAVAGWKEQLDELRAIEGDLAATCAAPEQSTLPAWDGLSARGTQRRVAREAEHKKGRAFADEQFATVGRLEKQLRQAVTQKRLKVYDYTTSLCGYVHAKAIALDVLLNNVSASEDQ